MLLPLLPVLALALAAPAPAAASPAQIQAVRGGPRTAAPAAPVIGSRYTASAFGYVDPNPGDFHPLESARTTLLRRDESILFYDANQTMTGVRREDLSQGRSTNGAVNFGSGGHRLMDAASGDLFGTGRSVSVTASLAGSDPWLRIWDTDAQGNPFVALSGRISTSSANDVRIACGDFDGDGIDEVAAAVEFGSGCFLFVFDDAIDGGWNSGGNLPRLITRSPATNSSTEYPRVCAAQLDGDDEHEVVFSWGRSGTHFTSVYDDLLADAPLLGSLTSPLSFDEAREPDVTAIRLDHSGVDALLVTTPFRTRAAFFDAASQSFTLSDYLPDPSIGGGNISSRRVSAPCPVDDDGDGIDSVVFVVGQTVVSINPFTPPQYESEAYAFTYRWRGLISGNDWGNQGSDQAWTFGSGFGSFALGVHAIDVVSLDEDLDGDEEFRCILGLGMASNGFVGEIERAFEFGGDPDGIDYTSSSSYSINSGYNGERIAIVAGDDDGESTALRWNGHKENVISQPIPIVVMEAVPTRFGVGQNLNSSSTQFSEGSGASEAISSRVGVSASLTAGATTPDLFGLAAAQATATLSAEVARTTGTTESVRTFVTQTAGPETHAIVFQGTLFTQYHYEVLSAQDPSAVGTTYAINVPVATEQWRWPLALYNGVFPARAIDPGVVFSNPGGATVVGDPASYPTQAELTSLVAGPTAIFTGYVGADANVAQGTSGSTTFGLELSTVSTTTNELTTRVELGSEFKVGGAIFGASVGLSNSWLYEIETSSDATFSGTIGDLPPSAYFEYDYKAGVVVYEDDTSSIVPFRVIRFWTDPRGTAYP